MGQSGFGVGCGCRGGLTGQSRWNGGCGHTPRVPWGGDNPQSGHRQRMEGNVAAGASLSSHPGAPSPPFSWRLIAVGGFGCRRRRESELAMPFKLEQRAGGGRDLWRSCNSRTAASKTGSWVSASSRARAHVALLEQAQLPLCALRDATAVPWTKVSASVVGVGHESSTT